MAFENHSVKYLDDQELINRYSKLNKSFEILKISPIHNKGACKICDLHVLGQL